MAQREVVAGRALPGRHGLHRRTQVVIAPFLDEPDARFKRQQNSGDLRRLLGLVDCLGLADRSCIMARIGIALARASAAFRVPRLLVAPVALRMARR